MLRFARVIACCFVACFVTIVSYAQRSYSKTGIEFSYGVFPLPEVSGVNKKLFTSDSHGNEPEKTPGTGAFCLSYNRFTSQRFAIGISALYDKTTVSYKDVASKLNWNVLAVLINTEYNYVYDPRFHMYSGFSAGYAAVWAEDMNNTERNNGFAFQARVIGARFGTTVGAFAELGFGYEGVVKAGLSLLF